MRRAGDYAYAFLSGEFGVAAQVAEDLLELGRSFGPDDTEGTYGLQMYMIRRETGVLEQVRPLLSVIRQSSDTWEPGLLALCTELGLAEDSRDLLWQLLDRIDETAPRSAPWAQWTAVLVFLVEAALALRDVPAARRLRPLLAPYAGQQLIAGQFVAVFGPADTYLAALDSLLGERDSAERLFAAALEQATGFGALVHRASTLTAWAAHLSARAAAAAQAPGTQATRATPEERARITEMRAEARRLAAATGQARLLRLLDQADTSRRPDERESRDGPGSAGLTPREIAVLGLLTAGSSNREIASRLRISENTAANHVRSILLKTGAANRTQVATLALSRGWVADPAAPLRVSPVRSPAGTSSGTLVCDPLGSTMPLTSTTTSAGKPARCAARRIESANGASYRQYVLRLSADRNEYSHRTPSSSLIRLIWSACWAEASSSAANRRSTMKIGMSNTPGYLQATYRVGDTSASAPVVPPGAAGPRSAAPGPVSVPLGRGRQGRRPGPVLRARWWGAPGPSRVSRSGAGRRPR